MVMLTLIFGITMGIIFGVKEDAVKSYIAEGIATHKSVHDSKSQNKIWRYAQRSHFHATGISAFSIGLVLLVLVSSLKASHKKITSALIGLGGLYPFAWFVMFLMAPSIGREAAHHHFITKALTFISIGGLLLGLGILIANLFFNMFQSEIS